MFDTAGKAPALEKLQKYAEKVKTTAYDDHSTAGKAVYEDRLNRTVQDLREQVEQSEDALNQFKSSHGLDDPTQPSQDLRHRLRQIQILSEAHRELTPSEPALPNPGSPIPALLAVRQVQSAIDGFKVSIPATHARLTQARLELGREQSALGENQSLTGPMEARIASLEEKAQKSEHRSPQEAADEMIEAETLRAKRFDEDTKALTRSLAKFINGRLGAMLAAEELGGPVTGHLLDVTDEMLAAGFTTQGKGRRAKAVESTTEQRQQRIDRIWASRRTSGDAMDVDIGTEAAAAASEMLDLVGELLRVATESGTATFVGLKADSAAARFLVRVKAAALHPRDARKIQLLDFGSELDS